MQGGIALTFTLEATLISISYRNNVPRLHFSKATASDVNENARGPGILISRSSHESEFL